MYVEFGESFKGHEVLDSVIGAQEIAATIPGVDAKVAHLKQTLSLLPLDQLSNQKIEMNASRAFIRSDERPFQYRECVEEVQLYGLTGIVGQMFRYLYSEDEPEVDDLGINIFNPVLIGFDVKDQYGIDTFSLQIPVREIVFAKSLETV